MALGAGQRFLAPLRFPPLAYLGKISYGLYLYHYPLYWLIDGYKFVTVQSASMRVVKLGATLLVAMASWHLIEAPILRLKDRFAYGRPRSTRHGIDVGSVVDAGSQGVVH